MQPFDRPGARVQVSRGGGYGPVWRPDAGVPQRLFAMRTQGYAPDQPDNFGVGGNGQKFLINTVVGDTDNAPLEVTLNWTAGLKK